jgi:hypothetical protein
MHFNAAMLEVHSRLHAQWSQQRAAAAKREQSDGSGGGNGGAATWLKTVKAAVMAARRRRRHGPSKHELAIEGAAPVSGIGNAHALKQVAAALVGGATGDGDACSGVGPALLCFDEFQVQNR